MAVEQEDSGIYYLIGDAISIQLVIVPKLSKEHNYWLNNLRNDLKAGSEIKKITESGLKSIDNTTITHSSVGDFCKETLRMSKKEKSEKNRKKLRNPENMGFSTFLFLKIDILGVAKK